MTSGTATRRNEAHRREVIAAARAAEVRRARHVRLLIGAAVVAVLAAIVAGMMLTSRSTSSSTARTAPDFTLRDTAGTPVHLADLRGRNVLLYFSEGAGCGSCIQQMTAIEKDKAAFDAAGITVLPIVMNTREQIMQDMQTYGATTPFLLDDGTVSKAYDTLGRGMHEGLPGHSFVLIDEAGVQRWFGEYPSMWLAPDELLSHVRAHLPA
jgi:peroxiredoxin